MPTRLPPDIDSVLISSQLEILSFSVETLGNTSERAAKKEKQGVVIVRQFLKIVGIVAFVSIALSFTHSVEAQEGTTPDWAQKSGEVGVGADPTIGGVGGLSIRTYISAPFSLELGGDLKIVDTNVHVNEARGRGFRFDDFSSRSASDTFFGFGGDARLNVNVAPGARVFGMAWTMAGDTTTVMPRVSHRPGDTFDIEFEYTPNIFTGGLGAEFDFTTMKLLLGMQTLVSGGVYGGARVGEVKQTHSIQNGGNNGSITKTDTTVSPVLGGEITMRHFFLQNPIYFITRVGAQQTLGDEVNSTVEVGNTTSFVEIDTDHSQHYYFWFGFGVPLNWSITRSF